MKIFNLKKKNKKMEKLKMLLLQWTEISLIWSTKMTEISYYNDRKLKAKLKYLTKMTMHITKYQNLK